MNQEKLRYWEDQAKAELERREQEIMENPPGDQEP